MKVRNLGGRETTLEKAGQKSITLGEEHRQIIARRKGDRGISEYIRDLIMEDANPIKDSERGKRERKENIWLKKELKVFERKEMAITHEHRGIMKTISMDFSCYLLERPNASLGQQQSWIESRCKGTGISPIEMTAYIKNPDVFSDKMSEKEQWSTNL